MNTNSQEELEIDLREVFGVLMSRIWILILSGIFVAGGTAVFCKFVMTPIYHTTLYSQQHNKHRFFIGFGHRYTADAGLHRCDPEPSCCGAGN